MTAPNSIIWIESGVAGVEWSVGNRMVRLSSGYLYLFIREFEESLEKPPHQRNFTQLFWDKYQNQMLWRVQTFLSKPFQPFQPTNMVIAILSTDFLCVVNYVQNLYHIFSLHFFKIKCFRVFLFICVGCSVGLTLVWLCTGVIPLISCRSHFSNHWRMLCKLFQMTRQICSIF